MQGTATGVKAGQGLFYLGFDCPESHLAVFDAYRKLYFVAAECCFDLLGLVANVFLESCWIKVIRFLTYSTVGGEHGLEDLVNLFRLSIRVRANYADRRFSHQGFELAPLLRELAAPLFLLHQLSFPESILDGIFLRQGVEFETLTEVQLG